MGVDLQPNRATAFAPAQLFLDRLQQVVRLVLVDGQVEVARDPERSGAHDLEAREQIPDVHRDDVLEQREAERRGRAAGRRRRRRQLDDSRQDRGDLHHRGDGSLRRDLLALLVQPDRQVQAPVAEHRERVPRVDGQRRQHGPDLAREVRPQPGALGGRQLLGGDQLDRRARPQRGLHLVTPAPILGADDRVHARADGRQLGRGGHAVGRGLQHASRQLLLEAGDPDHEELVQVRANNPQELQPLGERDRGVLGLLEHPGVELQPRQLAVQEQARVDRARRGRRLGPRSGVGTMSSRSACHGERRSVDLCRRGHCDACATRPRP